MEPNAIYERPIYMTTKRTPEQKEKIRVAFWMKWAGTMPATVIYSKGITKDEWYIQDITNAPENVTKITPDKTDIKNI
jgi:hypothetical protein